MFCDRQKLDVCEAHLSEVRHEPLGHEIPQRALIGRRWSQPRAEMNLVDCNRGVARLPFAAGLHPSFVVPNVGVRLRDNGSGVRWRFGLARDGICFLRQAITACTDNVVFVARADCHSRQK